MMLGLPYLLVLSMIALLFGAILGLLLRGRGWGVAALKGIMASFLGGLLLIHLLPKAYEKIGALSLLLVLAGFLVMLLPEKLAGHQDETKGPNRFFTAEMLWFGLILHQLTDGVGLALASDRLSADWHLALIVIAHRIPVAAVVVWLFHYRQNGRQAWVRILGMALATLFGAVFSRALVPLLSSNAVDMAYAFIAGSFLHLMTHDFLDHHAHSHQDRHWEFLGFTLGIGLLLVAENMLLGQPSNGAAASAQVIHGHVEFSNFMSAFLILVKETAPYLLLGLIISGLLHAYMPSSPVSWLSRGTPLKQSVKGMVFGLPLPICSCGVLPLFLSLAKKGVPTACLLAFLIATPELGIDSYLLSVKLLGWKFSTVRLLVAMVLPIAIALTVLRFLAPTPVIGEAAGSCCKKKSAADRPKWWKFAAIDLVDDIFPFVFFGLTIAAVAQTIWPVSSFGEMVGTWDVLVLGALGIPFYVCASASVPFALILLQHGFSVGAVVVFLFAGPATNVATVLTVNKAFGPGSGIKLAATAFVLATGTGFLINFFYTPEQLDVFQMHAHGWAVTDYISVAVIGILGFMSLYRSGPLHWLSNVVGMIPGAVNHPPTEAEA